MKNVGTHPGVLLVGGGAGKEEVEQEDQRGVEQGEEAGEEPAEAFAARFACFSLINTWLLKNLENLKYEKFRVKNLDFEKKNLDKSH